MRGQGRLFWAWVASILVLLAVTVFAGIAHAKPKAEPRIEAFASMHDGATFAIKNPLRKPVLVRFECVNAYSVEWLEIPARKSKTISIKAMERIQWPCELVWKVRK
jgi:hypothetical protein